MKKTNYNKTQLTPDSRLKRNVYHRDQFAHVFRWSHIFKKSKREDVILDLGCGTGEMLMLLYANRRIPKKYYGVDIRKNTLKENIDKFKNLSNVFFIHKDLCDEIDINETFNVITCFEVIEHIGKKNIDALLDNISYHANKNTRIYISTPNYDKRIGVAKNHIIDGEIGEWEHFELEKKLKEYFNIENKFGTFASIKDYKHLLNEWQTEMFNSLFEYYDTEILSNLMAPLFPEQARNCLWELRILED